MMPLQGLLRAAMLLGFAGLLAAENPAQQPVLGTVTQFKTHPLAIGVKPDGGEPVFLKFSPDTQVLRVPPGEHGLAHAKPAELAEIVIGDRVLVSFVDGMTEARRIVVISANEISKRNENERLDWQKRGVSGFVAAKSGSEITLETRTPQGKETTTIAITDKTKIRRYAPDSVKFTEAEPSTLADVAVGDQFQARGDRSDDRTRITAEDIVFGTFLTTVGTITAVNRDAGEIIVENLANKKSLTIRLTADSRVKLMPNMRPMIVKKTVQGEAPQGEPAGAHNGPPGATPGGRFDMVQMMERLPVATIEDLKVGGGVMVTSTRGSQPDRVTAIMVLGNADALIQTAQRAAGETGKNPMEILSGLHGGMMSGPTGLNVPAILQ